MFCAQNAAEFREHQSEIESKGARLVFIGSGTPRHAAYFRAEVLKLPPDGEPQVLTDPKLQAYKSAQMKRGPWRTLGIHNLLAMIRALKAGFKQRKTMGDAWQQGGVLVVDRGGKLRFSYASEAAGDHPRVAEAVAALPSSAI